MVNSLVTIKKSENRDLEKQNQGQRNKGLLLTFPPHPGSPRAQKMLSLADAARSGTFGTGTFGTGTLVKSRLSVRSAATSGCKEPLQFGCGVAPSAC